MDHNGRLRFQLDESPRLHEMPVHPMIASSTSSDDDDDDDVSSSVVSSLSRDDSLLLYQQHQQQMMMMVSSPPVHNSHLNIASWHYHGQTESFPPKEIVIPMRSSTEESAFQTPDWLLDIIGANAPSPSSKSSSSLDWQQTITSPMATTFTDPLATTSNINTPPSFQIPRKMSSRSIARTTATNQDYFRTTPTTGLIGPPSNNAMTSLLESCDPSPLPPLREGKEVSMTMDYYSTPLLPAVSSSPQDYDFTNCHDASPVSPTSSILLSIPGWASSCRTLTDSKVRSFRETPTSRDDYDKAQRMDSIVEQPPPQHDSNIPSFSPTGYPPVSMMWSSPNYIHRPAPTGKDFILSSSSGVVVVGGSKSSHYTEPTSSSSTGDFGDGHVVNVSMMNKSTKILIVGRPQDQSSSSPLPPPPPTRTVINKTNNNNNNNPTTTPTMNRRSLLHRRNSLQHLWHHLSWKSKRSSFTRRRRSMTGGASTTFAAPAGDVNVKVHTGCFS